MVNVSFFPDRESKTRIGDKVLCWQSGRIFDQEKETKLAPLPLTFLKYLSQNPGELISREQLLDAVWENRYVSDDAIRGVVKKLREALCDDAKSPRYIKTIPLKGYMLIAGVSEVIEKEAELSGDKTTRLSFLWLLCTVITALIIGYLVMFYPPESANVKTPTINIEQLTHLSGEEEDGDFSELLQTILFSYTKDDSEPPALYRKNLLSRQVERLSFEKAGHFHARFSPDSTRVSYIRETDVGLESIVANYSAKGLSDITAVTGPNSDKEVLSWSSDGTSLYFRSSQFELNSITSAIYRYRLSDKYWQQITFPHVKGSGNHLAEESPNGRYLAVVRNTAERRYSLLVLDLVSKEIKSEVPLPFVPTKLLWLDGENKRLAMSSFKGELYYFDSGSNVLLPQSINQPGINDIFYHCGVRCFYMHQHKLNRTDIIEIPNPFEPSLAVTGMHHESNSAEYHPVYNLVGDSFYFYSKEGLTIHLMRKTLGQASEKLFSVSAGHIINQLSIHPEEQYIAGKIEGRAFIYNQQTKKLTFITSPEEFVNIASWDRGGQFLYFSRLEQNRYVLLKYNVSSGEVTVAGNDIKGRYELKDGRNFVIDDKDRLYELVSKNSQKFIVTLPQIGLGSWQIQGEFLYFVEPKGMSVFMNRINMINSKEERKVLFKNSWVPEFSLHSQGKKMLVIKTLSDEGNLVKVQWSN